MRESGVIKFAICTHLSQWNCVRNGIEQNLVSVVVAKMSKSEASYVQYKVEEVIQGQRAHQQMEVPHNLQKRPPVSLKFLCYNVENLIICESRFLSVVEFGSKTFILSAKKMSSEPLVMNEHKNNF